MLVHRSRRARLNIVTKAKRSRFEKPVSVTFFREEWGRNVEAFHTSYMQKHCYKKVAWKVRASTT